MNPVNQCAACGAEGVPVQGLWERLPASPGQRRCDAAAMDGQRVCERCGDEFLNGPAVHVYSAMPLRRRGVRLRHWVFASWLMRQRAFAAKRLGRRAA